MQYIWPELTQNYVVLQTLKMLKYRVVGVPMNDTQPWTLEPWHMRVAFRINGFVLPESAIEMPPREISGPHKNQHRKEFYVTVSVMNCCFIRQMDSCVLCVSRYQKPFFCTSFK